jgi:hypothetical protein
MGLRWRIRVAGILVVADDAVPVDKTVADVGQARTDAQPRSGRRADGRAAGAARGGKAPQLQAQGRPSNANAPRGGRASASASTRGNRERKGKAKL